MKTSNTKESSFLMVNDNRHGYSSDEDHSTRTPIRAEFIAIQEANEDEEVTNIEAKEENTDD